MRRIHQNVTALAFVALFSGFGQDLITPILPAYLAALGVGAAGIGLIDGLLHGATSLFRFISGVLSDRYGNRKQFVFAGYALSSLARPLLAFAASLPLIGALRTLDGAGKGAKDAPRDALIADSASATNRGRSFGFHRLVDTAGSVLGPAIAGLILLSLTSSLATYRFIFLLAAIPGAIALALIAFGVRESPPARIREKTTPGRLPLPFWMFTVATSLALLTKINDSLVLLRAQDLGAARAMIPFLFAGFTLVYAAAAYPLGAWSDRVGRKPFIIAGWLILALAEFGFAAADGAIPLTGLFVLYGLFYAFTEGSGRAFISDLVPADRRGTAFAIFHTTTGLAIIFGGFAMGRIWDVFAAPAAFSIAGIGSLGAAAVLMIVRHPWPPKIKKHAPQ